MNNSKALTLLGFASKARKLSFGADAALKSLKEKKAKLIVAACDVSEKSRKEAAFFANKAGIGLITFNEYNMTAVSDAVGRRCGILSVNDSGFAGALLKAYVEGGNANDE